METLTEPTQVTATHFHSTCTAHISLKEQSALFRMIKTRTFSNPSALMNFENELLLQSRINHPGFEPYISSMVKNDDIIIGRNYLKGLSLSQLIYEKGVQPRQICLGFLLEIAQIIDHLHDHDIIVRNLKPENVIIDEHSQIKLVDCALTAISEDNYDHPTTVYQYTMLAPIDDDHYTKEHDVYHLGILAYLLFVGHLPVIVANLPKILSQMKSGQISFPSDIDTPVRTLVKDMLCPVSKSRPTIKEVIETIKVIKAASPRKRPLTKLNTYIEKKRTSCRVQKGLNQILFQTQFPVRKNSSLAIPGVCSMKQHNVANLEQEFQ